MTAEKKLKHSSKIGETESQKFTENKNNAYDFSFPLKREDRTVEKTGGGRGGDRDEEEYEGIR